jgi:hypothetical protein
MSLCYSKQKKACSGWETLSTLPLQAPQIQIQIQSTELGKHQGPSTAQHPSPTSGLASWLWVAPSVDRSIQLGRMRVTSVTYSDLYSMDRCAPAAAAAAAAGLGSTGASAAGAAAAAGPQAASIAASQF